MTSVAQHHSRHGSTGWWYIDKGKICITPDATVSLLFALQFDVNVEESAGDGPDRQARINTFSEWIDMLRKCGVFSSLFFHFVDYTLLTVSLVILTPNRVDATIILEAQYTNQSLTPQ